MHHEAIYSHGSRNAPFFGSYIDFLPAFQIPLGLTRENLIVFHGEDWVNYCGMSNFFEQDVHKKLSILLANRYDVVCTLMMPLLWFYHTGFWRSKQGLHLLLVINSNCFMDIYRYYSFTKEDWNLENTLIKSFAI